MERKVGRIKPVIGEPDGERGLEIRLAGGIEAVRTSASSVKT